MARRGAPTPGSSSRLQRPDARPVRADPRRLRQVLDGLAENALRVTAAGRAAGARGAAATPADVVCRSATAAPGWPPRTTRSSFERGALHDRYRGRRPVGTGGVGLALVHGLVTRMGGTIRAEPAPEGGACFTLTLPADDRRGAAGR